MMAFSSRNLVLVLVSLSALVHHSCGFGITRQRHGGVVTPVRISQTRRYLSNELTPPASSNSIVERLDLTDNFNRWKYMQNLLDEELEADDVNPILYLLLFNYKTAGRVDPDDSSAPERTVALLDLVDRILLEYDDNKSIPALQDPDCQPGEALFLIEKLLPDPLDKEDASKGAWDTVGELHGKTAMASNEREGRPEWKAVCMVARVMIYFEFLTGDGLVTPPGVSA
jgi:hypothetical protein